MDDECVASDLGFGNASAGGHRGGQSVVCHQSRQRLTDLLQAYQVALRAYQTPASCNWAVAFSGQPRLAVGEAGLGWRICVTCVGTPSATVAARFAAKSPTP